jgi:lipopolysaccharide export system permease protein
MPRRLPVQLAKTLSAYIARQFFGWFCGVFGAIAVITFLADYVELIRRGGEKPRATLGRLFVMALLQSPQTAQEALPFAVLFGTMLAFWRLTRNNELVVARAAGVSVWQFLVPAVLVALLVGIFAVTVFNPIASVAEANFERLEAASSIRGPTSCRCRVPACGCARAMRPATRSSSMPAGSRRPTWSWAMSLCSFSTA